MMLHTKYQGCGLGGFRQEDLFMFPYLYTMKAYVKYVTPGAGPFLSQGHNMYIHSRCPLDDATY